MADEETTGIPGLDEVDLRIKGFKVHTLPESTDVPVKAGRRDFYKMGLVNGDMTINYGGQLLDIKGTALFFVNPHVPHALVRRINRTSGYACIFTETFLNGRHLQESPLFRVGQNPVVALNAEHAAFMTSLFQKMLSVYDGDYLYKSDLIKTTLRSSSTKPFGYSPRSMLLPSEMAKADLHTYSPSSSKGSSRSNAATNRSAYAVRRTMPGI